MKEVGVDRLDARDFVLGEKGEFPRPRAFRQAPLELAEKGREKIEPALAHVDDFSDPPVKVVALREDDEASPTPR